VPVTELKFCTDACDAVAKAHVPPATFTVAFPRERPSADNVPVTVRVPPATGPVRVVTPWLFVVPERLIRSVGVVHPVAASVWKIPVTGLVPRLVVLSVSEPEICGKGTLPDALTCQLPLTGFWGVS